MGAGRQYSTLGKFSSKKDRSSSVARPSEMALICCSASSADLKGLKATRLTTCSKAAQLPCV